MGSKWETTRTLRKDEWWWRRTKHLDGYARAGFTSKVSSASPLEFSICSLLEVIRLQMCQATIRKSQILSILSSPGRSCGAFPVLPFVPPRVPNTKFHAIKVLLFGYQRLLMHAASGIYSVTKAPRAAAAATNAPLQTMNTFSRCCKPSFVRIKPNTTKMLSGILSMPYILARTPSSTIFSFKWAILGKYMPQQISKTQKHQKVTASLWISTGRMKQALATKSVIVSIFEDDTTHREVTSDE